MCLKFVRLVREVRRMLIASKGESGSEWYGRRQEETTHRASGIMHVEVSIFELYSNDVYF